MNQSDLDGPIRRPKHYKQILKRPKNIEDRLDMILPKGPKEYVVGSTNVYISGDNQLTESSNSPNAQSAQSPSTQHIVKWIQMVRVKLINEFGAEAVENSYLKKTASHILDKPPREWFNGTTFILPPATSQFS